MASATASRKLEPGAGGGRRPSLNEEFLDEARRRGTGAGAGGAARRWPWSAFARLPASPRAKRRAVALRAFWRGAVSRFSSPLTRRIILLNLGGLFALLIGFLYLNQFREGLIDARIQSLRRRARSSPPPSPPPRRSIPTPSPSIPKSCSNSRPANPMAWTRKRRPGLEFSINPDRVGPLLRRLVSPTRTRARIYDRDG